MTVDYVAELVYTGSRGHFISDWNNTGLYNERQLVLLHDYCYFSWI